VNFKGTAQKLQPNDVAEAAQAIGVTEAHLRTVMEVECNGHGFDAAGRPEILFEPHKFWANLGNTAKRQMAYQQGLAYPKWGMKPYPKTQDGRYAQIEAACQIDETAALKSASWGLGQIMGSEFDECGYDSPQAMVQAFCESERNQAFGMAYLIKYRGLDKQMLEFPEIGACRSFALHYNGGGYEKNRYHTKLHDAYIRWAKRLQSSAPMQDDGTLRMASKGVRVTALQTKLDELGYHCSKDGVFGNRTRDAVLAWQADNGVDTTGEVTAEDFATLESSPPRPISAERAEAKLSDIKDSSPIVKQGGLVNKIIGGSVAVVGGANGAEQVGLLDNAQNAVDKVQQASGIFGQLKYAIHSLGLDHLVRFVVDHSTLFMGVGLIVAFFVICNIRKMRLMMHRVGEVD